MVFNSPTELDLVSSDRYMYERNKLLFFNYYLRLKPHIFSHITLEIRFNKYIQTPSKLPPEYNIYVVLRGSKKFCQQINCQAMYPRGQTCTETDTPKMFKSGNSDIAACHSSCYNLFDKKKDKAGVAYRAPFTKFNEKQNCCAIYGNDIFAVGMDDYNRTDKHTTPRIDTIGTGFDLADEPYVDIEGNETFQFKMNKYYCEDFMKKWDGNKCYTPLYEEVFGFLVSSTLYKACQYGVRYAQTGVTATSVNKPPLPEITTPPPPEYHEWLSEVNGNAFFINPHVTLTDLGITSPGLKHLIFTTEYGWPGRLVEPLIVYQEIGNIQPDVKIVDFNEFNKNKLIQFKYDSFGQRLVDEYDFLSIYKHINQNALANNEKDKDDSKVPPPEDYTSTQIFCRNLLERMFNMIFNWNTPLAIGIGKLQEYIIDSMIKGLNHIVTKLESGIVTHFMFTLSERLLIHSLMPVLLKPVFKLITMTLKVLSSTIKTVDAVVNIVAIIDLIDLAVDFFNLNNEMGVRNIHQYSEMDILSRKKNYGYGTVEYSPIMLMSIYEYIATEENDGKNNEITAKNNYQTLLPPASNYCSLLKDYNTNDAKWKLKIDNVVDRYDYLSGFVWSSEYLYSLEVNSNGLPINWNEEGLLCEIKDINEFFDTAFKDYLNSFDNYYDFSSGFRKKINLLKFIIPSAFILLIVFTYTQMIIAILFLLFVSSAVYAIVFTDIITPDTKTTYT